MELKISICPSVRANLLCSFQCETRGTLRSAFSLQTKNNLFQICTTPLLSTSCKDCSSFRSNCCIGKMKVESSTNIPFFHRNEDSKHYRNVVKTTDTTHLENLFQKLYLVHFSIKMKQKANLTETINNSADSSLLFQQDSGVFILTMRKKVKNNKTFQY